MEKRGKKEATKRKQYHKRIPVECIDHVVYEVDLAIILYCRENKELYLPARERKKIIAKGKKTEERKFIVLENQKTYNYYRYIPEIIFNQVSMVVTNIIDDYVKEKAFKDSEPKLTKKMQNDGFLVSAIKDGFSAIKDGFIINRPTLCDLFEEIYESRVYNENLKSSY